MKKCLFVILALVGLTGTRLYADDSASASSTPTVGSAASSTPTTKHKKKKNIPQATPVADVSTPVPTVSSSPKEVSIIKEKPTPTPAPVISKPFSSNIRLYDRMGAPGDLRKAVALAVQSMDPSFKHERSIFLWLGRVTGGDGHERNYVRFSLDGVELGGPRKPWLILAGKVYDQSGSDFKNGDPIEVAVDFHDVKVDYEGTKLGEIQKGNDISDQYYEILTTHTGYQWVLLAQDNARDSDDPGATPAFTAQAREGYAFLETLAIGHSH